MLLIFGIGVLFIISLVFFGGKSSNKKPKTEPIEIYKVVFDNGHIDTLKLKPKVYIEWNTLYSDGSKVANGVSYIKKLN